MSAGTAKSGEKPARYRATRMRPTAEGTGRDLREEMASMKISKVQDWHPHPRLSIPVHSSVLNVVYP